MDAIKTTFFTLVSDIRYFFYAGFQNLPLSIAGIAIVIGFLTANYGLLFFLFGYLVLLPAGLFLFNLLPLKGLITEEAACFLMPASVFGAEVGRDSGYQSTGIGYWVPMTFFFIGYIMTNAVLMNLYELPPTTDTQEKGPDGKPLSAKPGIDNRKANTYAAMLVISVLAILCIVVRSMSCEGPLALLLGILLGGFSGVGWYYALSGIADHRTSDLFGMANRLLIPYALSNQPYACLPSSS